MNPTQDTRFFGHPRGLSTLFFTELWERFGYYGMRALLVLFMVAPAAAGGLALDDTTAYSIYGLYTASVYGWSLPGGWLADRFLGQRRAVMIGGSLIALGYLMLALPSRAVFFSGLAVVVLGTGLLKPNISTIVGQIYTPDDTRRDAGFSIFYMGINIGAFISPLICGYAGQRIDWRLGFALAGIGMSLGVLTYWRGQRHLGAAGLHPVTPATDADRRTLRLGALGIVAAVAAAVTAMLFFGITAPQLNSVAGVLLLLLIAVLFGWLLFGRGWTPVERKRLVVVLVLFLGSAIYWAAFEQAGSSLNVFAARKSANEFLGWAFPASWYQSLNAMFIIALAPVLAWVWLRLGKRQPSSPAKFAFSLILIGLSFFLMMWASQRADGAGRVGPQWLLITYLMHTVGELCLSPVGLSAMTQLAPRRVAGFMMGVWFVSLSLGNYMGGRLAAFYGELPMDSLFRTVALFALVAGVVLALLARPVARLIGADK
jgi:POT family proton-dependent oligopeptide transporter